MGGSPKGLLAAPDTGEALVARALRLARSLALDVALVGDASPYRALVGDTPVLDDEASGSGPLGGLCALLAWAAEGPVIALACDHPYVTLDDLRALRDHPSGAAVVAARRSPDAPWEPLLARYDSARVLPVARASLAAGERGFQRLFARLEVERFTELSPLALQDWDEPSDLG